MVEPPNMRHVWDRGECWQRGCHVQGLMGLRYVPECQVKPPYADLRASYTSLCTLEEPLSTLPERVHIPTCCIRDILYNVLCLHGLDCVIICWKLLSNRHVCLLRHVLTGTGLGTYTSVLTPAGYLSNILQNRC